MTEERIAQLRKFAIYDPSLDEQQVAILHELLDAIVELKKDVAALNKALVKAQKARK